MQAAINPKDMALDVIKKLPSNSTMEEILHQLSFISNVMEGLKDVEEGKVLTTKELREKLRAWRK